MQNSNDPGFGHHSLTGVFGKIINGFPRTAEQQVVEQGLVLQK
jgi:hypothetical protein